MSRDLEGRRKKKLAELHRLFDELHALLILSRQYNADIRRDRENALRTLPSLTNKVLEAAIPEVREQVSELANALGCTQPLEFYVEMVRDARIRPTHFWYFPKYRLRQFFANIENLIPGLKKLPEHTRLSVDIHGLLEPGQPGEIRIIEAALFEDLCATFNRAWFLESEAAKEGVAKPILKESASMKRAAVLNAFYLVEAYLNSIAFDHLILHGDKLSVADADRLTEWDSARHKEKFVSFRDKLLSYPRIILGVATPPIQENNCRELAFLLDEAKEIRDSIVHANPRPTAFSAVPEKELRFWRIGSPTPMTTGDEPETDTQEWIRIVDNAIIVIEKVEALVYGTHDRLFWLQARTTEGPFSERVFD